MTGHLSPLVAPALACALFVAVAPAASEQSSPAHAFSLPGEKIDSGLGTLPPYGTWSKHPELRTLVARANPVPGEKLDSGLGELKHYRYWADSTGRVRKSHDLAAR